MIFHPHANNNSFLQERWCTWPHFQSEGFWNSEVAYWRGQAPKGGWYGSLEFSPPHPTLSFLPLSYRLAFSVRFFFLRPIPNNRACSHPTSSNNTGAKKEENMSCTRLIELHSSLIYTGIMKIILICRTRQLCFITRYAFTRNTVCNWDFWKPR